ncbi:hypothetical protein WN55_04114 [Dufourea novaeangliae]|uniref:Uncharacterized protein n=2 Tax=Dufourea novaeangliae TaxID=178035 RepID=A0A154PMX0_DUFNO|nr:hypothetical protein WN55_04114 [Dufourea novaeangliae]
MENVVACLEHVSLTYYCICSILIKLLPINMSHKDLLTEFKTESFKICGEINYQKLKTLYHIYILVQSEMLHLLATSYDSHTWQESCNKIPEFKLAYIVDFLNKYLTIRKGRLSNIIHAYYSFKVEPISYTHKESTSSHWQDLYMHLYLASNRLQVAHGHILSVLQNIDDNTTENTENKTVVEDTLQKLNQAQKDLENAKDFIEFSSLYLLKTQIHDHTENHSEMNMLAPIIDGDIPIVHDSEPLIMDEVFEEYIKEEYLKPLIEESDEIPLYNYKRDKSLFKNFMIELKDVLVDKQRSMSERELKALHRMHKSVISETALENKFQIPRPPSMPSLGTFYTLEEEQIAADKDCNNTIKEQLNYSTEESKIITRTFECEQDEKGDDHFLEHKSPISFIPLPRNKEFTTFLPPLFLKTGEETFTGSGENSEDEVIDIQ